MNRFRVNLHPAFFNPETAPDRVEETNDPIRRQMDAEKEKHLSEITKEVENLKAVVLDNFKPEEDILSSINDIQKQKLSKYTDEAEFRKDQKRFLKRIKNNSELWNQKIVEGLGDLITVLKENKYFDDKNLAQELQKIKDQYWNEVKQQYADKVWSSSDKEFDGDENHKGLKDILFGRESGKDYPANKIYCKLTGATTIFGSERTYVEGYSVDVLNSSQETAEEVVEGDVEETAEEDVEETAEEDVEETAEEVVEGDVEETAEGDVEETAEEVVEGDVEEIAEGTSLVDENDYGEYGKSKMDNYNKWRESSKNSGVVAEESDIDAENSNQGNHETPSEGVIVEGEGQSKDDWWIEAATKTGYMPPKPSETSVDSQTETSVDDQTETSVDDQTETSVDDQTETPVDDQTETVTETLVQNQVLEGVEQMNGGDIDFLSKTLPIYLWEYSRISKRVGDKGTKIRESVIGLFGVHARFDRASRSDEGAINKFLKAASKLEFQEGYDGDKALALMEVFHDNRLNENSGRAVYRNVLRDHKINIGKMRKSLIDDVIKAGSFYLSTQKADNSVRDQHAIYLSVLKVIETEGGVKNAVNKFRDIVEQGKEDRKEEKKQGYESDENLGEFKGFAEKLGISDFVSFNRLLRKDSEYFENTPVEKILANLNNDNIIAANDTIAGGLKTGNQILEIFNQVGKEKALHNLLERAKLLNKTLGLGLDENDFKKENIKNKNYKLIILLQNIINKPGEDLYTLLSGHKEGESTLDVFGAETLQKAETEGKIREAAFIEAGKIIEEKGFLKEYKKLFDGKEGVDVSNFADLQATLASCLYDNYRLGLGVGGTVNLTFNEWVKGITISTGAQVRDNKGAMLGLNIGYSKSFNVGNGWTLTPGLSAGIFLPIAQGSEKVLKSVGLNFTVDKKKVNLNTGTVHHSGFGMSYDVVTNTLSLGWHENRNKIEGLQEAATFQSQKFEQVIMRDLLDNIKNNIPEKEGKKIMDLDDSNILDIVNSNIIKEIMSQNDISEGDQEKIVDGMLRMLAVYNKVDLNESGVKYVIAKNIAELYGHSWMEQRKVDIQKGGTYISGYGVGAFWKVGTTRLGIYAGMNFAKHNADGYGDKWGNEQQLESENIGEWNDGLLQNFNKQLGWPDAVRICMRDDVETGDEKVYIPASVTNRVNVNPKLKGLMKKNKDGSVFLDVHTPMSVYIGRGAATQWSEVIIGGKEMEEGQSFQKLDALGADWFKDDIDQDSVLDLIESAEYSVDGLDDALDDLKAKLPQGDIIQNFNFSELSSDEQEALISKLNSLDRKQKVKIVLENNGSKIEVKDPINVGKGRGLEIEYHSKFEMMDPIAKQVADAVYAEAMKVKNPKALNDVKHKGSGWDEYIQFSVSLEAGSSDAEYYNTARNLVKAIFEKLDKQITGANFSEIGNKLDEITDSDALGQALMSIDNIFARSTKVRGGSDKYEFKGRNNQGKEVPMYMGAIIAERATNAEIRGKIKNSELPEQYKKAYLALIDASEEYRRNNEDIFNVTESKSAHLENTIGVNLGGSYVESLLNNPEIYEQMIDLKELEQYGFDEEMRVLLHKHEMENFVNNKALFSPILKRLGLENEEINIGDFSLEGEKGKLLLDIGTKKITLSSGMKFGFFTQCVNHTVVLSDISAETEDGMNVSFNSGTWENGSYVEGDKSTIVSTTELGVSVSVTWSKEGEGNSAIKTTGDTNSNKGGGGTGGLAGQGTLDGGTFQEMP